MTAEEVKQELAQAFACANPANGITPSVLPWLAEQHFAAQSNPGADAQEMLARIERLEGMIEGYIRQFDAHRVL